MKDPTHLREKFKTFLLRYVCVCVCVFWGGICVAFMCISPDKCILSLLEEHDEDIALCSLVNENIYTNITLIMYVHKYTHVYIIYEYIYIIIYMCIIGVSQEIVLILKFTRKTNSTILAKFKQAFIKILNTHQTI